MVSPGLFAPTPHSLRDPPTPCAALEVAECGGLSGQQAACFVFVTASGQAGRPGPVFVSAATSGLPSVLVMVSVGHTHGLESQTYCLPVSVCKPPPLNR